MFENVSREKKPVNPLLEKGLITKGKVAKSEAEKKQLSRRNIKVYDDAYTDMVALSQLKNMTHNELIVWLVDKAVKDLDEEQKTVFSHLKLVAEGKGKKQNR